MMHVKSIYKYLALLVFILCVPGCWDRVEMENQALVMGSGFDLTEDGQLEVTLEIALPTGLGNAMQGGGGQGEPTIVISDKGKDGLDAHQHLQEMLSRRIFLGQRAVIIFGEDYAREGIDKGLDTFLRSPESRYTTYILTAKGKTAREIMNNPDRFLDKITSLGLRKKQEMGTSLAVKLNEFLNSLASDGKSPITGVIEVMTNKADKEVFKLGQVAVYRENKLVGFLSEEEMKALPMLQAEAKGQNISMQIEQEENGFSGTLGVKIMKSKAKVDIEIRNELPKINITLSGEVVVLANDTKLDLSKAEIIEQVENKMNKHVDENLVAMLDHIQKEYKADVYGFGNEVHIKHSDYWKKNKGKWNEIYPKIPITTNVSFNILLTGRSQAPSHMKK